MYSPSLASTSLPLQMVAEDMPVPMEAPEEALMPPARSAILLLSLAVTLTFAPSTLLARLPSSVSLPWMMALLVAWLTAVLIAPATE